MLIKCFKAGKKIAQQRKYVKFFDSDVAQLEEWIIPFYMHTAWVKVMCVTFSSFAKTEYQTKPLKEA